MTEPRIHLADVRATAVRNGIVTAPDGELAITFAPWDVVLALVEAAEAAQAVIASLGEHGEQWWQGHVSPRVYDLRAALAPFTAETTNTLRAPRAREPLAPPKSTPGAGS